MLLPRSKVTPFKSAATNVACLSQILTTKLFSEKVSKEVASKYFLKALLTSLFFFLASLDFPEDALYRSEQELAATLKVSENVAHNLKREASSRIYPWKERHVKVCDMLDASPMPDCITLGDVTLDHVVGGGVFTKAITEVVGQRYGCSCVWILKIPIINI